MLLFVGLLATLPSVAATPAGPEGYWKTPSGATLEVYACGKDDCFKIVRLSPLVPEKTDMKNPDAKLRSRVLCHLQVGSGFKKVDGNRLTNGHIYDPETGHTYGGNAEVEGDVMKLRGYLGISLLGRTENWHRTPAVAEADCK